MLPTFYIFCQLQFKSIVISTPFSLFTTRSEAFIGYSFNRYNNIDFFNSSIDIVYYSLAKLSTDRWTTQ